MDTQTPLQQAVALMGGQTATARALGVSQSLIAQWIARDRDPQQRKGRPLPEEYCPAIEQVCGIRCEQLRPEIIWTRNEGGQITGYHVRITA